MEPRLSKRQRSRNKDNVKKQSSSYAGAAQPLRRTTQRYQGASEVTKRVSRANVRPASPFQGLRSPSLGSAVAF